MMISPEIYIERLGDMCYKQLLKKRDSLVREIRRFEKNEDGIDEEWIKNPSPEVVYQMNLKYLGKVCELIAKVYNRDYVRGDMKEEIDESNLLDHIEKLHSTKAGIQRVVNNLNLDVEDVVAWCKNIIQQPCAIFSREGKNWYVVVKGCKITVNATSYTIITAHKEK